MEERIKKLEEEICYLRKAIESLCDVVKPIEFHTHYNNYIDNYIMEEELEEDYLD